MKSSLLLSSLVIAALGLAGCADSDSAVGELGNGVFRYRCDSATRHCVDGSAAQFPRSVALGSRFSLSYGRSDRRQSLSVLQAVSSHRLQERAGFWQAMKTGLAGVVALDPAGRVEDYSFVNVLTVHSVDVWVRSAERGVQGDARNDEWVRLSSPWPLRMGAAQPILLGATDLLGEELAGESVLQLQCTPALLSLTAPVEPSVTYALRPLEAGHASCELRGYDKTVRFDVQVTDDALPDDAGATDAGVTPDATGVDDLELEGGAP